MGSRFAKLLLRLKRAASVRGKKADFAKFLNVPQSRVSEWLSGVYEPNAETTLQMLEWVTAEEAKQKAQGRADNTPKGRKTQSRKTSSNENRKSGPKPP